VDCRTLDQDAPGRVGCHVKVEGRECWEMH
jgi:hypothetical protein